MSLKDAQNWLISNNKFEFKNTQKAKTISITGGKGGVGKSSISIKFGSILGELGYKVLLIDCDYNLSNTAVKLGLPLNNHFNDLVNHQKSFDDCLFKIGNLHLLPGCNGNLDLFKNGFKFDQFIINLMMNKEKDYDFIILDCPAGIRKEFLTLNAYSDYRFVVVTPDKSSITDSYSLMKILNSSYGIKENHLLINKAGDKKQVQRLVKTLSETVENFLSCRLHIMEAIFYHDVEIDKFDAHLLKNSDSEIHKNFLKAVTSFTEKTLGMTTLPNNGAHPVLFNGKGSEQDVQIKT